MLEIQTIVHPTDFSTQADMALGHAALWARRFDAMLHLLHVLPGVGACRVDALDASEATRLVSLSRRIDVAGHLMEDGLCSVRADDLAARCYVAQSPLPAPAILNHATTVDADLIVMGCRGATSDTPHLGSTAAEIMRRSSCPVLLVDESRGLWHRTQPVQRLAVHVDFGQDTRALVDVAAALITLFRADVDLCYVIPTLSGKSPLPAGDEYSGADLSPAFNTQFHQYCPEADFLQQVATSYAVALRLHVRTGYPPDVLATFVREHAPDLLLTLAPGLSTEKYARFSAFAERIVHQATCPVLLINPSGKNLVTPDAAPATAST